ELIVHDRALDHKDTLVDAPGGVEAHGQQWIILRVDRLAGSRIVKEDLFTLFDVRAGCQTQQRGHANGEHGGGEDGSHWDLPWPEEDPGPGRVRAGTGDASRSAGPSESRL